MNNKIKEMVKNVIKEDAVQFKQKTASALYEKVGKKLQQEYVNISKRLLEAVGNAPESANIGAGLGGALGQGSPANQFMDFIENNIGSSNSFYQNTNILYMYTNNPSAAQNLINFPPQGSSSSNPPKGWVSVPGLPNTWKSPGGWVWSFGGGKWFLRPPSTGGGDGGGGTGGNQ